jgi:hypothetical protein
LGGIDAYTGCNEYAVCCTPAPRTAVAPIPAATISPGTAAKRIAMTATIQNEASPSANEDFFQGTARLTTDSICSENVSCPLVIPIYLW